MKPRYGLLIALLLAALLRFWQLDSFPPGLYHDEAYNGLDALMLWRGETFPQYYEGWELYQQDAHADRPPQPTRRPIFFEGNYGREPVHIYLMALSVGIFGNTVFAIRAVPALAGVLAVLTTWWAARVLLAGEEKRRWREWAPVYAAFLVAILLPAVHFSRFGLRAMIFVPVETAVIAAFWRGIQARERDRSGFWAGGWGWFLFAGIGLGAGIYIYAAGRLFPLLFMLFIPLWLRNDWAAWRRFFLPVGLMAAASLLTAAPLLWFFYQYPYFFIFRISYVANRGRGTVEGQAWLTWLLNVGRVVRGLFWQGETHLRHNLPGRPYLDLIQAGFFGVGFVGLLVGWLERRRLFVLMWLGVMLLPTIMSGDAPHFGRMTGAVPVIGIIGGLGMAWLGERLPGGAARFALPLLLLASTIWTGVDYFVRYAAEPQLEADFYLPEWELGQFIAAQGADTAVYLTPTQEEMATFYYAIGGPGGMASFSPEGAIPLGSERQRRIYLVRPSVEAILQQLQTLFPQGERLPEVGGVIPFATGFDTPDLPLSAANHQFAQSIILDGYAVEQVGTQLVVTLQWIALREMETSYTAFVHLLDAEGRLVAQLDRPPGGYPTTDWRPGEVIVDRYVVDLSNVNAGRLQIRSGFYAFPSLQPLGEPAELGLWERMDD